MFTPGVIWKPHAANACFAMKGQVDPKSGSHKENGLTVTKLIKLLQDLVQDQFWGEVVIKFQNGLPVLMVKQQKIKIDREQ